jgi:hypothetical protein
VGHPARVRPGQRYAQRFGRSRVEVTVRSIARDGFAVCVRPDGKAVRVAFDRLLATRSDGSGLHYRWLGWARKPGGYPTEAIVRGRADDDGDTLSLELPEWGFGSFVIFTRLVPEEARHTGARLTLKANLGARAAGALNPHAIALAAPEPAEVARTP